MALLPGSAYMNKIEVSTIEREPFVVVWEDASLSWFSIELRDQIATELDLEYTFVVESVFGEMLASVSNKQVDLAIANISISSEREETMDFSLPIYDSGIHMLIKHTPELTRSEKIQQLFAIISSHHIMQSILYWILFGVALYWVRTGQYSWRLSIIAPTLKKTLSILLISWLFVILFLVSFWIHQQLASLNTTISSYTDLLYEEVWAAKSTTMARFLERKSIPFTEYNDFKDSLEALQRWEVSVILGDGAVSEYYATHQWKDTVEIVWSLLAPDKLAIAFPEDSPLREQVDTILLEMMEDGRYETLKVKYFGQ